MQLGNIEWSRDGRSLIYKYIASGGFASFWSIAATGGRPRLIAKLDDPFLASANVSFVPTKTGVGLRTSALTPDARVALARFLLRVEGEED